MSAEEFKREIEGNTKILKSAITSERIDRKTLESWIYNKAREIKQNAKDGEVTYNLHHLKAALKGSNAEALSSMYVKMKMLELKQARKLKKKWKKRKIPGLNS